MDFIGIAALGALTIYIGYVINKPEAIVLTTPWNEQIGKTRSLQAKGDASMNTELIRRRAIQASGRLDYSKLKETRTQWGSATGALETFMMSSLCPLPSPNILYDGGSATDEFCPLDGDGSGLLDAGTHNTSLCRT